MKDQILSSLDNPLQLERLYRSDKSGFRREFKSLGPEIDNSSLANFWNARLDFAPEEISWGNNKGLWFVIIASIVAGFISKLPAILNISEDFFYPRNIGFIVFPALAAYFSWKNNLSISRIAILVGIMLGSVIFINVIPGNQETDTLILSCIHLVLILWSVTGYAFVAGSANTEEKRLGYLKYNGDLVVITGLIVIAGGILSGITIGLFSLIGMNIEEFYFKNIVIVGLPAAPIIGTYLIQSNPQLVGKVSPVIARIFSPLVLVMLVSYLIAMLYSGKDPYNDREFLMIFNALLIGVMAIIFFSIAEGSNTVKSKAEVWILLLLSLVTIIVNGIALSAIVFRISEWGITPNRTAILGANLLMLTNLLIVAVQLFRVVSKKEEPNGVGKAMAAYLPVYIVWSGIVTFLFPFIFGFR